MKTEKILSDPSPDSPRPWFKFTVQDGSPNVTILEENGLLPYREQAAAREGRSLTATERQTITKARPRQHAFSVSQTKRPNPVYAGTGDLSKELHFLLVTLDGDWMFVPASEQPSACYAHLAWYEPTTKEWTVLDFVPRE